MSLVDKVFPKVAPGAQQRDGWRRVPADAAQPPASGNGATAGSGAPDPAAPAPAELVERRTVLARELAELQWDLGGLAYEMAIRDHFRPDVLVRQAARLQQVDGELAEVERLLRMERNGASGSCPSCGALHSRGAVFCWQCGTQLMATSDQAAGPGVT